jgi:hypothetical protein
MNVMGSIGKLHLQIFQSEYTYLSKVKFMRWLVRGCSLRKKIYSKGSNRDLKALGISIMTQLKTGLGEVMRENDD